MQPYAAEARQITMRLEHEKVSQYLGRGDDMVALYLTFDAINPGLSYFTVAASLSGYFAAQVCSCPREQALLTAKNCAALFGPSMDEQPTALPPALLSLRSWPR